MTPRDFAVEIEPNASPERLNQIEQILHKFAADEFCRVAMEIDDADRENRIRFPGEASTICRNKAQEHLNQT